MMKKFISMMILTQFLLPGAYAGDVRTVKSSFDELSYVLTVEWDQNDPLVAKTALQKFSAEMKGFSDEEKAEFFKALLKGRAEMEAEIFVKNIRECQLSREEAVSELQRIIAIADNDGASWLPVKYIVLGALGGAALIFVAGLLMWELSDPDMFGEEGWK